MADREDWLTPFVRNGGPEEAAKVLQENRGVMLTGTSRPVLDDEERKRPASEIPVMEITPVIADFHSIALATLRTQVHVFILRDGDVTIQVLRDGEVKHTIDVDPEPGVERVTKPDCKCEACSARRARRKGFEN